MSDDSGDDTSDDSDGHGVLDFFTHGGDHVDTDDSGSRGSQLWSLAVVLVIVISSLIWKFLST